MAVPVSPPPSPSHTTEEGGIHSDVPYASTISYEKTFVKTVVLLMVLIFLAFLFLWLFRKCTRGRFDPTHGSKGRVRILERRALSPKSMLYLVEVGDREIVLIESQLQVSVKPLPSNT